MKFIKLDLISCVCKVNNSSYSNFITNHIIDHMQIAVKCIHLTAKSKQVTRIEQNYDFDGIEFHCMYHVTYKEWNFIFMR